MIIDNKIDGFPLVSKVMAIVPLFLGSVMLFAPFLFLIVLGLCLIFLSIAGITAQERVRVDFAENKYKRYFRVLGMPFGKWKSLKRYDIITLTNVSTTYREINYSPYKPPQLHIPMVTFKDKTVALNLKRGNSRMLLAKGNYQKLMKIAISIGEYTGMDIHDFIHETNT